MAAMPAIKRLFLYRLLMRAQWPNGDTNDALGAVGLLR
jgi:hypothetical protein